MATYSTPLPQVLSVQLYVISPRTCLISPHPFLISSLCFFGLNPISERGRETHSERERERGKEEDEKRGRKEEKATNECFIFCLYRNGTFLSGDKTGT